MVAKKILTSIFLFFLADEEGDFVCPDCDEVIEGEGEDE